MYTNHLIQEKSPYLLQHAHNPVDWYPWCPEAFEKARREGKPVFLSIGYSTCHWCHVMERESFEDPEVAEVLNRSYVSVKVDREERPDVDGVYMEVCLKIHGSGGWPLTVLMTAEQEPFFAGTYFPKGDRYGQAGLLRILRQAAERWEQEPEGLIRLAASLTKQVRRQDGTEKKSRGNGGKGEKKSGGQEFCPAPGNTEDSYWKFLERGALQLEHMFDKAYGGFSDAPKFPMAHNLLFLLRMAETNACGVLPGQTESKAPGVLPGLAETGEGDREKWLQMAEQTLLHMYRGGIFDHVGGGFSRYSTDEEWLAPHFEKMLYDNALLALAYLEGWRMTKRPLYREVAERIFEYLERELRHEKGGFFCGQDADSEGIEGKYYVFTPQEVVSILGEEKGEKYCGCYDITSKGNFEGKSIPNLRNMPEFEGIYKKTAHCARELFAYRRRRTALYTDDKILTSWNGLVIWALARAYQLTGVTAYYKQAKKAAGFLRANLMTLNGRLKVRWREEQAAYEGNLDDYAFYGLGLYELYQCDFDVSWLRTCVQLAEKMLELFGDKERGGFFFSGTAGEPLIHRPKETYDGALPSGNSAAGLLLVRLAKLTGNAFWEDAAKEQLSFLAEEMEGREAGHTLALLAMLEQEEPGIRLVCVTKEEIPEEEIRCFRKAQREQVYALAITGKNQKSLGKLVPETAEYPRQTEGIRYYLCRGGACQPPVEELSSVEPVQPIADR